MQPSKRLLLSLGCALGLLLPNARAMLFRSEAVRAHWDTWCFFHDGTYYTYYLITEYGYGEGVGLATSRDGVHWEERGRVLEQSADNTHYLGSGAVWKAADFEKSGRFIMNYSEHRRDAAGKQTQNILFAWSTDLVHWTKYGADTMFSVDPNHYDPHGRWDCIFAFPRAEGGFWGTWSATGKAIKGTVGVGFSEDGVKWTALPPPAVEVGAREAGAFYPIGGKLHAMFIANPDGGMWAYAAETIQGPFRRARKNPHLGQRGPTAFSRFFPTPMGLLANHNHWTGTKLTRTPKSDGRDREITYLSPFKRIEVDAEGVLRWKYWEGNEALKGPPVAVPALGAAGEWTSGEIDLNTGLVLEATVAIPEKGGRPAELRWVVAGKAFALRVGAAGVVEMEALESTATGWRRKMVADREWPFAGTARLRVLLRAGMLEAYLDDHYLESWTLMGAHGEKAVALHLPAPGLVRELQLWQMALPPARPH